MTAARVVERLASFAPGTRIHETWRQHVEGMGFPEEKRAALLDPDRLMASIAGDPVGFARVAHACTHTTIAPTVAHGGTKTNVTPDRVDLQLDIGTLAGQTAAEIEAMLDEAIGPDLAGKVTVVSANHDPSTASPADTPLWHAMQRACRGFYHGASLVPTMTGGATDARFFRRPGMTAYGFGLFSSPPPVRGLRAHVPWR